MIDLSDHSITLVSVKSAIIGGAMGGVSLFSDLSVAKIFATVVLAGVSVMGHLLWIKVVKLIRKQ